MGQVRTSWILDLKDMISRPVQAATRAAHQLDAEMERVRNNAHRMGASLRKAFSLGNLKDSLMDIPGMKLFTNPYVVMGAGIGAITKLGMEAENSAIAFEVFLGSGEKATKMLADISKMAAKTPFEKMDLQNAAQQLLTSVDEEKVLDYMKQLGDIAVGDRQKFQSLALVFGQVTSSGKLNGQDLMQFINAGFNPLKELQEMTGKTYAELQDAMSKGQISADMVAAAMKRATSEGGKFYQMMDKMSASTGGRISTVIGNIKDKTAEIFKYIAPLIAKILELVDAVIPPIFTAFEKVISVVSTVIQWFLKYEEVLKYVGIAVGTFYTIIKAKTIALYALVGVIKLVTVVTQAWATVTKVLNMLFISSPIGWIATIIGGLAAAVVYCWDKFEGFRAFILGMWDTIKQFGEVIGEYLIMRFYEIINAVKSLSLAFKKLFSGDFAGAYESIKNAFSNGFGVYSKLHVANESSKISFTDNLNRRKEEQTLVIPANAGTPGGGESGTVIPGMSAGGKGTKGAESLGIGGSGSGKGVTLTVHMTNNFNLSGEGDVKRIVERVKQELVTVLTDVVPA